MGEEDVYFDLRVKWSLANVSARDGDEFGKVDGSS
jgi:hypothetical protein